MNNGDFLEVTQRAALAAGQVLLDYVGKFHVREKGRADLVTEADVAAQEKVKEIVLGEFPDHVMLGEENTAGADARCAREGVYRWIVDPLDGTTNYVHGVPMYSVSLALERGGELLTAAVYVPQMGECFTAARGGGAWLNGKPMRVSGVKKVEDSLIAVSFPPAAGINSPDVRGFLKCLNETQAIRRTGSTAINMAYVAAGRFDACWNFDTNPWDMAGGALLVAEAGGKITTIGGEKFCVDGNSFLAASTAELHGAFREMIG